MKRKAYGRDAGLTTRMLLTTGLLGLLYVVFAVVLFNVLSVGLVPMLVIVIGLAVFQFYTSDKIALAASGAKVVQRDEAPELHDMVERLCAMISAVWFFGQEPKEAKAGGEGAPAATTAPAPPPSSTAAATTQAATTKATTTTTAPAAPQGDPAAGKQLFAANGCTACHTFKPAGATGKIGPDLDKLAADAQKANQGTLEEYTATSIKNPGGYVVPGFPNGVMPGFTQLTNQQLADLVAFLTQKS